MRGRGFYMWQSCHVIETSGQVAAAQRPEEFSSKAQLKQSIKI